MDIGDKEVDMDAIWFLFIWHKFTGVISNNWE
jgi:hypothetical protein